MLLRTQERKFSNPLTIDPNRDAAAYTNIHGDGVFKVLGDAFVYRVRCFFCSFAFHP